MKEEELLAKLDEWFETVADYGEDEDKQAYEEFKQLLQQRRVVTRGDVFNFHNNLMTISEEEYQDTEKCIQRELEYIASWLKELGIKVKEEK